MTVKEMAEKYYPEWWSASRLRALVAAGKLTQEEYDKIINSSISK